MDNKVIWKYQIIDGYNKKTDLRIPVNSKLLHIGIQSKIIMVWFEVDKEEVNNIETRTFYSFLTGSSFNSNDLEYRKTIIFHDTYVVHIYEKRREEFLTNNDMII